jgi:SAM-dependent methyltransferase
MVDLKNRSNQFELLDEVDHIITTKELYLNLKELNTINTYLGGHQITIAGVKALLINAETKMQITIVEIGCGGGDNLVAIAKYCTKQNINVQLIGIDLKRDCIAYAQENCKQYPNISFQWDDYRDAQIPSKNCIIFNSLFCHHFTNDQLIEMANWMKTKSSIGFFINDLHRHFLAYYSIKWITKFFSTSYLVKHDACLSVARGFTKQEWMSIFKSTNLNATIQWKWAFRHLIVFKHG